MKKLIFIFLTMIGLLACSYSKEDKIALDRAVSLKANVKGFKLVSYLVQHETDTANGFNLYIVRMEVDSAGELQQISDTLKLYRTLDGILLVPGDTLNIPQ